MMSFEQALLIAAIPGTLALIGVIIQMVKDRKRPQADESSAYESLTLALKTSGQTIDDLFKQLAEVSALKKEVSELTARLNEAQQRISSLEDERDRYIADNAKKDARIKELEGNNKPTAQVGGFGTRK